MHPSDRQDVEIELLIRALQRCHGYDFSGYSAASFKRRVQNLLTHFNLRTVSDLTARVIHEDGFVNEMVARLSVPVSEMFRDPEVFAALREHVLPVLASYPRIAIWQAGCARGEEVYSMAILLQEEGLYDRCQIYATDFNDAALERAQEGVYPAQEARQYAENYLKAGGRGSLHDYFHARYDRIKLNDDLKRNITFANHNLVSDGVFSEVQLILCRNVLIYFADPLKERVLSLFRDSLVRSGFLCLGSRESLQFSGVAPDFSTVSDAARIYRLKQPGEPHKKRQPR